jgi:hypothetical protein
MYLGVQIMKNVKIENKKTIKSAKQSCVTGVRVRSGIKAGLGDPGGLRDPGGIGDRGGLFDPGRGRPG